MNALFRWFRRSPPPPDWIEPADLAARLPGYAGPLVLDVRGPDEFDGPLGHIAGAMNVPFNELPGRSTEFIHQARPVVVVCKTDRRSLMAAQQLRKAGMPNVSVLRGRHGTVAGREPPRLQSPPRGDYP